jgi:ribosomal protein S18 acetylase RimI-like enzyme
MGRGFEVSPAPEIDIRPYETADRAGVRRVCYLTGFMGESADWMWRDEESFADIFTGYWTDREPECATVAVLDGEVVGYLLGSKDSRRVWNAGKQFAHHAFGRGMAFRPGTAGVIWRMVTDGIVDSLRHRLPPPTYYDERWPAHLHIDLLPVCRERGIGASLVSGWLGTLRSEGIAGCHLQTMAENSRAIAFFEKMGFTKLGEPKGAPGFRMRDGARMGVQLMVQSFRAHAPDGVVGDPGL